ncbi:MAG: hypothetical protein A2580_14605 [Hydrogenophilales bacterium RIFOXYD1_FULL_62_11]|nr:MAG: hypothetical protein A2580_14605 [Hydrogenophilales bacterium RIFOXYD1_FULL_62_11]
MVEFFEHVAFETATEIEQLSRLAYELRENHHAILKQHDAESEMALLQQIQTGKVTEHPAYEHYLAARILADTREEVRATLAECLKEANQK